LNLRKTAGFLIRSCLNIFLVAAGVLVSSLIVSAQNAENIPAYSTELNIPYCIVDGKTLIVDAFLPGKSNQPVPAMVEIHGGWWSGGSPSTKVSQVIARKGIAYFSISYRLGKDGGFPQNIRDCRNAIRFIRKNAARFNIDPARISCMGGSAGGHLSLMVAMVPEDFDDGGPTDDLKGISAGVCSCFSFIPPTDFVRFWDQGPDDIITNPNGTKIFREPDPKIPYDSRPRLRILFHGIIPDTEENRELYTKMCPMGHINKNVPPLLICDGEKDPIVPGLHGKALYEKLKVAGADVTYWMTPLGGHDFPGGPGFQKVLDDFLVRTLKLSNETKL
jgi:acetyl esterase/lipase